MLLKSSSGRHPKLSKEIISKNIKQWAMQEEVRIIFNSSIANTHWTDALKIVSESMLV